MKKINFAKWLDGFALAFKGLLLAFKSYHFWIAFVISFLFFGVLMNFLPLIKIVSWSNLFQLLFDSLLKCFCINKAFWEFLPIFLLSAMQGILIGLIVILWRKKRANKSADVEKVGVITGLIALGAGCPTCGATLIAPLIGSIISMFGGLAANAASLVGVISTILTIIAIIIAIFSFRRLGEEVYVIITSEKFEKRRKLE